MRSHLLRLHLLPVCRLKSLTYRSAWQTIVSCCASHVLETMVGILTTCQIPSPTSALRVSAWSSGNCLLMSMTNAGSIRPCYFIVTREYLAGNFTVCHQCWVGFHHVFLDQRAAPGIAWFTVSGSGLLSLVSPLCQPLFYNGVGMVNRL